ncbi:magnesium transporter CorA family protein [Actinophytocola oryzae]|uniref:Magnesium transporter n=1 Tax=Actinophytocola oryzae TaxID=502181 RepID=A0A4R7VY23_9PSEU|nr:magnesium transporter CorA family protein [Actinophytocola oryzae]TDV55060.1 magnesium transporter [Actinophytocola oryzae]
MARTRLYRDGKLAAEDFPAEEITEYLHEDGATVWLDLVSPSEEDLERVAVELGLHELAVEDAVQPHQRPKIDVYDTHCFLTAYSVAVDKHAHRLTKAEVDAFVTDHAVVTVHDDDFDMDEVVRHWDSMAHLAKHGTGFLVHGLVDHVVDTHHEVAQHLDDLVESLEDKVFTERPGHDLQRRVVSTRRSLVTLRRVVLPMREVVNSLVRSEPQLGGPEMTPYFQDVYDHVLQSIEWTESLREFVATIRETQLNVQGNRLNLIMKKVTSWAAIIAVPTAITGFYGQNLPVPGAGRAWGFWVSSAVIVVTGVALYRMFKRRDWL